MCPACMATMAWMVAGATSAGGVTALVMKKLSARTREKNEAPTIQTRGEPNGSPEGRIAV